MSHVRVEVIGQGEFDAREWLRRDVLWASLITPYDQQMRGWLDGTQVQQHNGNISRRNIFQKESDVQSQSIAFFNQGKNIAGMLSSVALFRSYMDEPTSEVTANILKIQAFSIDKVLGDIATSSLVVTPQLETETYNECERQIKVTAGGSREIFGYKGRMLLASNRMAALATAEASTWVRASLQNEEQNLPVLTINNGGHPRSAGPRVELLHPIFQEIVSSQQYSSLAVRPD